MTTLKYRKDRGIYRSWFNLVLDRIGRTVNAAPHHIELKKTEDEVYDRCYEVFVFGDFVGVVRGSVEANWTTYAGTVMRRDLAESTHWHYRTAAGAKNHHRLYRDSRIEAIADLIEADKADTEAVA